MRKNTLKKKPGSQPGFAESPGSTEFRRVFAYSDFLFYLDWSSYRVNLPGNSRLMTMGDR